jgi:hypothetical protein
LNPVSSWFIRDSRGSTVSIMARICRAISFMSDLLQGNTFRSYPAFKKTTGSRPLQKPKAMIGQAHFQVRWQAISYFSSSG